MQSIARQIILQLSFPLSRPSHIWFENILYTATHYVVIVSKVGANHTFALPWRTGTVLYKSSVPFFSKAASLIIHCILLIRCWLLFQVCLIFVVPLPSYQWPVLPHWKGHYVIHGAATGWIRNAKWWWYKSRIATMVVNDCQFTDTIILMPRLICASCSGTDNLSHHEGCTGLGIAIADAEPVLPIFFLPGIFLTGTAEQTTTSSSSVITPVII